MRGSFRLVKFAGIPVEVHWSFALLFLWVGIVLLRSQIGIVQSLTVLIVLTAVFASVVFHEYGHALVARMFGVRTKDIILTPIGGVARLEHIPEQPYKEILIALAGPGVNLLIALLLVGYALMFTNYWVDVTSPQFWWFNYAQPSLIVVAKINFILLLFNLLPAFPMDGGRVLRASLATFLGRSYATLVATRIGQVCGLVLVGAGLFEIFFNQPVIVFGLRLSDLFLAMIGAFVFFAAGRELASQRIRDRLARLPVSGLIDTDFPVVGPQTRLAELTGFDDEDYVVLEDGKVSGILFHEDLPDMLVPGAVVADHMRDFYEEIEEDSSAWDALVKFRDQRYRLCPVIDRTGKLVGVIRRDRILSLGLEQDRRSGAATSEATGHRVSS